MPAVGTVAAVAAVVAAVDIVDTVGTVWVLGWWHKDVPNVERCTLPTSVPWPCRGRCMKW